MPRIRSFDLTSGSLQGAPLLEEQGWTAGQKLVRKADKKEGILTELGAELCVIEIGGQQFRLPSESLLQGEWRLQKRDAVVQQLDCWRDESFLNSWDYEQMVLRMQVLSAVQEGRKINEKSYAHLELFLKPARKVQSTKAWQKNALQLYPCTNRVEFKILGDMEKGVTGICLGRTDHESDPWVIYLQPPQKSYCPVFFMKTSGDLEECNMVLSPVEMRFKGSIPACKNVKPVKAGDELVLYKAQAVKSVRELEAIEPAAKKARKR